MLPQQHASLSMLLPPHHHHRHHRHRHHHASFSIMMTKNLKDAAFHERLDHFKQLVKRVTKSRLHPQNKKFHPEHQGGDRNDVSTFSFRGGAGNEGRIGCRG
jgi:tRNA G46 methylase TrmB